MSLKTFHLIFITCSILMCFGFGAWGFWGVESTGLWSTIGGLAGFASGIGLIVYEVRFLRKLKGVSYL
ncbi:MAG: hypothetical protein AB1752_03395 [Candidatus Zixiibacteriota bacterium]